MIRELISLGFNEDNNWGIDWWNSNQIATDKTHKKINIVECKFFYF
jgi:hypothetical protein